MTRKCSHCGHNGHNSRTCPDRGVRLFGVRLTDGVSSMNMRKSVSMNNLSHYASAHNSPLSPPEHSESGAAPDGYVSDGLVQTSNNARERKKGVPWTEDEHRLFLIGLQKLGKGDWRGISRNFVQTRTPTQVASHAQKYFIRQSNMNKRKRRSSLFDIVSESGVSSIAEDSVSPSVPELATTPIHQLSLGRMYPMFYETSQLQGYGLPGRPFAVPSQMSPPMALPLMSVGNAGPVTPDQVTEVAGLGYNRESLSRSGSRKSIPIPVPAPPQGPSLSLGGSLGASQVPYSFNSWPGVTHTGFNMPVSSSPPTSNVVRPTAKVAIAAPSVVKTEGEEDMKDIAQLSLGLSPPEPSQLTLKLLDQPSRHSSAFHRKLRAQIVFAKTPKGRIISSYFCKEMLYAKEASELFVTVRAQSGRKPGI